MKIRLETISCAQLGNLAKDWLDPTLAYGAVALLGSGDAAAIQLVAQRHARAVELYRKAGAFTDDVIGIFIDGVLRGYVSAIRSVDTGGIKTETLTSDCVVGFYLSADARGRGFYRAIRDRFGFRVYDRTPYEDYLSIAGKEFEA